MRLLLQQLYRLLDLNTLPLPPAGNAANGRIVSHASSSSDDSDQDRVPALLSSGLSCFPEHCRRFKYGELEEATSGFDDELAIGEGAF